MRDLSNKELPCVGGGTGGDPVPDVGPCNNGWGNGESCAPGRSGEAQAKFEDNATGASPSNSGASGNGNR